MTIDRLRGGTECPDDSPGNSAGNVMSSACRSTPPCGRSRPGYDDMGDEQAISAETGGVVWHYSSGRSPCHRERAGLRAFPGLRRPDEDVLREINLGSPVSGFPITCAVDGRQYVDINTRSDRFFELPPSCARAPTTTCSCSRCPDRGRLQK